MMTSEKAQKSAAAFQKSGKANTDGKASFLYQQTVSPQGSASTTTFITQRHMLSPSLQLTALASWADNSRFLTYLISEDRKTCWLARSVQAGKYIPSLVNRCEKEGKTMASDSAGEHDTR